MEQERKAKRDKREEVVSQSYRMKEQRFQGGEDDKAATSETSWKEYHMKHLWIEEGIGGD